MNNNIAKKSCYTLLFVVVFLNFTGCEEFADEQSFKTVTVNEERIRSIEPLDLDIFKAPEQDTKTEPEVETEPKDSLELTLESCRAITLQNNLDLKVQLINPSIAAETVIQQEADKFESLFYSNLAYQKTDRPPASDTYLAASTSDDSRINLGVDMPLRTGGTVSFDITDSRSKNNSDSAFFNPAYATDFSISVSHPLLRNAGKRAATYFIRAAQYSRQQVNAQTSLEVITAIAAADQLYWQLYASRKELDVLKKQHDLAKALYEQAERFVDVGERPLIEAIRAEAGVARQLAAIIATENTVRDNERRLKLIMNKPDLTIDTPTIVITATEPDPVKYELDKELLLTKAIANRMELLQAELEIAKALSEIDYRRNQSLPLLTANYSYTVHGIGASQDDSYKLLDDKDFEDHYMGLSLQIPLGNESAKSKLREAIYKRRQQLATKQNRELLVKKEVLAAIDLVETNWQQLLSNRQSAILEGRLYSAELRQFQIGLNTSTDVLQAQTTFANAQSAEIQALANYQISLIELARATGTLLGAAKVEWEPIVPTTSTQNINK